MKKSLVVFALLLFIASLLLLVGSKKNKAKKTIGSVQTVQKQTEVLPQTGGKNAYQPRIETFGAVEVEVIPEQLKVGQEAVFNLLLNTHSVELEYDYIEIASLTDNRGNSYRALTWDGGRSGHHLKGILTFEPLEEDAGSVTLKLLEIDKQTKSFTWEVLP